MTGSLQIKNNKYYVVTYVDKKQKWISTKIPAAGNNFRKAQKRMREILAELDEKKIILGRDILLADYIKLWLEEKKNEVELNTWESYEMYVNSIVDPYFRKKNIKLQEATPQDIRTFFSHLQKGSEKRKPHSVESIKRYRVCLNGAFKMAMENDLIAYNPVDRVTLKKSPEEDQFKGDYYSIDEANLLLKLLKDDPLYPVIRLTLFCGLRRSEVIGLKWSAVDLVNNTIHIEHTVVQTKTLVEKNRTKNKQSNRSMPIVQPIKEMLLSLKKDQEQSQRLLGQGYIKSDRVFRLADGTPMQPNYVTQRFNRLLKQNADKIRKIRLHDLRHTTASLLLANGMKLHEIQAWLGHESIKSTERYAHLQVVDKIPTAERMAGILHLM